MTIAADIIQVKGLGRHKIDKLAQKAKRLGMTPERYIKQLVEEDLAISDEARTKSFAEIMGPGKDIDEDEIDSLVEKAKTQNHIKTARKKR